MKFKKAGGEEQDADFTAAERKRSDGFPALSGEFKDQDINDADDL